MPLHILDAYALMAYLEREEGFDVVKFLLTDALTSKEPLLMTSVNLGEVLYIVLRENGRGKMEEIERLIRTFPMNVVDVDLTLAREAANIKAFKRMSYTDCFAAALAKSKNGILVTGNPEFKEVEGEIRIEWL